MKEEEEEEQKHIGLTCVFPPGAKHDSCWYRFYSATEDSSSVRQSPEWPDLQGPDLSGDGEFAYDRAMKISILVVFMKKASH